MTRAWDPQARCFVEPKSRAGTRTVPIIGRLAVLLADHAVLNDHRPGRLFGRYGHLFPGSEHEARGLLDAYLGRFNQARARSGPGDHAGQVQDPFTRATPTPSSTGHPRCAQHPHVGRTHSRTHGFRQSR